MALVVGGVAVDLTANSAQIIGEMNKAARAVQQAAGQMQSSTSRWSASFNQAERGINASLGRVGAGLRTLQGIAAAVGASLGAREIIRYSDAWQLAAAQLRLVSDSAEDAAAVQDRLFDAAQNLGIGVDALNTIFIRTSRNADSLGVSTEDVIAATEALGAAVRISGTNATEASNALIQLSQSFASGVLRGDELRSVAEQLPVVLDAIAAATGKTRQEVINYARENGIAADLVIQSLQRQRDAWVEQASVVGGTVEQAMTRVQNAIQQLAGRAGEAGAFQPLIDGLNRVADAFQSDAALGAVRSFFAEMDRRLATTRNEFARLGFVVSAVMEGRFQDAMDAATGRMREFEETVTSITREQAQVLGVPFMSTEPFGPPRPPPAPAGPPLELRGAPASTGVLAGTQARAVLPPITETRTIATAPLFVDQPTFGPEFPGAGVLAETQRGQQMVAANEELIAQYAQLNQAANVFSQTVTKGLTDAITKASTFGEALQGIITSLAEAALQAVIFQGVTAAVGTAGGGGLLGSLFAPPRASGGPVTAGHAYTVGERGTELFVPTVSGRIMPNQPGVGGGGGGGGGTIINNIYADQIDPGTVSRVLNLAYRQAPTAIVNAQSRGRMRGRAPF